MRASWQGTSQRIAAKVVCTAACASVMRVLTTDTHTYPYISLHTHTHTHTLRVCASVRHKSPMYVSWAKCVCVSYVFRSVHCLYLPSCVYRGSVSSNNNMTGGMEKKQGWGWEGGAAC